jgi:ribose transport system substrate-binding protein
MYRRHILLGAAAAAAAGIAGTRVSAAAGNDIVIGLSNGYFGTEWRNQMVDGAQRQFDEYKAKGMAKQLVVQQAGADVNQQIQDIRNMIRQGVSAITVNANSATALNGVINEAKRAHIPVVSFDQKVTNPYAVNVTVDHYQWGKRYAEWVPRRSTARARWWCSTVFRAILPPRRAARRRSTCSSSIRAFRSFGPVTACGTTPRHRR